MFKAWHVKSGLNLPLKELAADIKRRGIEQALTVRKNGADGFVVIHGERRRRAALLASLEKAPVIPGKAKRGKDIAEMYKSGL